MKTVVKTKKFDTRYKRYKANWTGYIDDYVEDDQGRFCAVVVFPGHDVIALVPFHDLSTDVDIDIKRLLAQQLII